MIRRAACALLLLACSKADDGASAPSAPPPQPTAVSAPAPSASSLVAVATNSKPEWIDAPADGDFASTVRLARAKASKAGRLLVVYVGADWCPPCKVFHKAVLAGELDRPLANVTFLAFDFDRDAAKMGAFGYQTTNIPYFVKPGPDAKVDASFKIVTLDGKRAVAEAVEKITAWR